MMDGGDDVSGIMMSAGSIGVYCFLIVICHCHQPHFSLLKLLLSLTQTHTFPYSKLLRIYLK